MWIKQFDNTQRHCWERIDGTRFLNQGEGDCNKDHSDNPKVTGKVEWMRFIHSIRDLGVNVGDVKLSKEGDVGVETYPDFIVYLNTAAGTASIACVNESLSGTFQAAYDKVQASYG